MPSEVEMEIKDDEEWEYAQVKQFGRARTPDGYWKKLNDIAKINFFSRYSRLGSPCMPSFLKTIANAEAWWKSLSAERKKEIFDDWIEYEFLTVDYGVEIF